MTYRHWYCGGFRPACRPQAVREDLIPGATAAGLFTQETLWGGRVMFAVYESLAGSEVSLPKITRGLAVSDARLRLKSSGQTLAELVAAKVAERSGAC